MNPFRAGLAIALSSHMCLSGAGGAIGSINTYGEVRLNSAEAPNGATVFDGQTLSTVSSSRAVVALSDRTRVTVGPASRMKLSSRSLVLENGAAEFVISSETHPSVYAAGLQLAPESRLSMIKASTTGNGRVNVAIAAGQVRVIDASGTVLKTIQAGDAFVFGLVAQEQKTTQEPQGRSGGQAPGVRDKDSNKKAGAPPVAKGPADQKKKNNTAVYVLVGAGAAAGIGAAVGLSGHKRGS
jgi:hypothetical protein